MRDMPKSLTSAKAIPIALPTIGQTILNYLTYSPPRAEISGETGKLERTKDGTNKVKDMPKRANYSAKVFPISPGGRSSLYYKSDEIK